MGSRAIETDRESEKKSNSLSEMEKGVMWRSTQLFPGNFWHFTVKRLPWGCSVSNRTYMWIIPSSICYVSPGRCWRGLSGWRCSGTWRLWEGRWMRHADAGPRLTGSGWGSSSAGLRRIPRLSGAETGWRCRWCSEPQLQETTGQRQRSVAMKGDRAQTRQQ